MGLRVGWLRVGWLRVGWLRVITSSVSSVGCSIMQQAVRQRDLEFIHVVKQHRSDVHSQIVAHVQHDLANTVRLVQFTKDNSLNIVRPTCFS